MPLMAAEQRWRHLSARPIENTLCSGATGLEREWLIGQQLNKLRTPDGTDIEGDDHTGFQVERRTSANEDTPTHVHYDQASWGRGQPW